MLPHASMNDHASAIQRVLYDKQITEMMELNFARKLSEEEIIEIIKVQKILKRNEKS